MRMSTTRVSFLEEADSSLRGWVRGKSVDGWFERVVELGCDRKDSIAGPEAEVEGGVGRCRLLPAEQALYPIGWRLGGKMSWLAGLSP